MKVRSKRYMMFIYGIDAKAYVHVYPQQKWEVAFSEDKVSLSRKGISLDIKRDDFEKYFIQCAN